MFFNTINTLSVIVCIILFISILYIIFLYLQEGRKLSNIFPGLFSVKYQKVASLLLAMSIFLMGVSFLEPQWSEVIEQSGEGIDVVFALDVSKSMNVPDVDINRAKTTRLDAAKMMIADFVRSHPENRYGLVIFSGEALSTVPLTSDEMVFLTLLRNVDYRNLTKQGTDIDSALALANGRFDTKDDKGNIVLLISDGGDIENTKNIAKKRKQKHISYLVLGVGTKQGGKIITGQTPFGEYRYQTYKNEYVISKLNETKLKNTANILDGEYMLFNDISGGSIFKDIQKKTIQGAKTMVSQSMMRSIAMVAFVLLLLYLALMLLQKKHILNR